jgi:hypothetical protein
MIGAFLQDSQMPADVLYFPQTPRRLPNIQHVATLFSVVAPSGARVTCAAFEVDTALELRLEYGDDTMRSELFRGVDRYEQTAEAAYTLRRALLEIGFTEIDIP